MPKRWRMVRLTDDVLRLLEAEGHRMAKLADYKPMGKYYKPRFSFNDVIEFLALERHDHRRRAQQARRKASAAKKPAEVVAEIGGTVYKGTEEEIMEIYQNEDDLLFQAEANEKGQPCSTGIGQ